MFSHYCKLSYTKITNAHTHTHTHTSPPPKRKMSNECRVICSPWIRQHCKICMCFAFCFVFFCLFLFMFLFLLVCLFVCFLFISFSIFILFSETKHDQKSPQLTASSKWEETQLYIDARPAHWGQHCRTSTETSNPLFQSGRKLSSTFSVKLSNSLINHLRKVGELTENQRKTCED